jgi:hypothetical protein
MQDILSEIISSLCLSLMESKLSDFLLHTVVAAGFSLRFSSLDRAKLSFVGLRKFRNLKVAATKSLNLGEIKS